MKVNPLIVSTTIINRVDSKIIQENQSQQSGLQNGSSCSSIGA